MINWLDDHLPHQLDYTALEGIFNSIAWSFGIYHFTSMWSTDCQLVITPRRERHDRVSEALKLVAFDYRAKHRTYELLEGKQQRVAISRAHVYHPIILRSNEPTGQPDSKTGAFIIKLLHHIAEKFESL